MMENAFYFTLKTLLYSRYLNFCIDFLVVYKNDLIRKIKLISKFKWSQPGKQITAINILATISRSKGNQTIKFGQLIEYYIKSIFLKKSYTKFGGETFPRPFFKK